MFWLVWFLQNLYAVVVCDDRPEFPGLVEGKDFHLIPAVKYRVEYNGANRYITKQVFPYPSLIEARAKEKDRIEWLINARKNMVWAWEEGNSPSWMLRTRPAQGKNLFAAPWVTDSDILPFAMGEFIPLADAPLLDYEEARRRHIEFCNR